MSKRSEVEWQAAMEVASRHEGKLAWCQATKQWLQGGKPVKLRDLHFMADICEVAQPKTQSDGGYCATDYWARCMDLTGFQRVTANIKWLLHKDRVELRIENIGLTQQITAVKRRAVEQRHAMERRHADKLLQLRGRVEAAIDVF